MPDLTANELAAEKDAPRATVAEALAAWEAKGPTSLTVALLADALYGVRDEQAGDHGAAIEFNGLTHSCEDSACHVAGFVTTLERKAQEAGVLPPGGSDA